MNHNALKFLIVFFLGVIISSTTFAALGNVRHIISHNNTMVVTDPTKGYNAYRNWAVFPSQSTEYRKVILYVTYKCPDSLHCGEWDYLDEIFVRRIGSADSSSKNIEIGRMISPYGWRFDSTWQFTWHVDITDFALLLHDSVEIEFNHGGYESSTDRGWLVTLDFAITEGKPEMKCLGIDTLWCGSFPYGDNTKPIDNFLLPISFANKANVQIARLRITQTGHGMDDLENCAEFCNKYRKVIFDDSLVAQRQIWRKCGDNSLYPQAGTWIYDRANWCPGSIVYPDIYDYPITPNSVHTIDIKMEPYINPNHPSANYRIYSYLFYYSEPPTDNDVSLEEILAPGINDEQSRVNPICSNPRIVIKNCGKKRLTSMVIKYGLSGDQDQKFNWKGILESQKTTEIILPGVLAIKEGKQQFGVSLELPNRAIDEYKFDNTLSSQAIIPPICRNQLILAFVTNNDSTHNSYQLMDANGNIIMKRKLGSLKPATAYRDTFNLLTGCYNLTVIDTAGDGLDFWANPEGGYGYVRLLDINGHLIKSFLSDFGSEINYSFEVADGAKLPTMTDELPIVNPFPIRNKGTFTIDIFFDEPTNVNIQVVNEDSTRKVYENDYRNLKEAFLPIDISGEPDGFYFVKITTNNRTVVRKIKVKHQD
jgi:hypothetical protein